MEITDQMHPRVVSRVGLPLDEWPHWLSIDRSGRRLVMNSSGYGDGNRMYVMNFDPQTGALALDYKFRDPGSARPGVSMTGKTWPHGFTGKAAPHGTVFSR
jgi:hypothetical protein